MNIFKSDKFWCGVAGAAIVIVGKKVLQSSKTRDLAVAGVAKGMQCKDNLKSTFQSIKDEAADICYDAKAEAGLQDEEGEDGEDDDVDADAAIEEDNTDDLAPDGAEL